MTTKSKGFTLIEVLVAIVVLVVGFLSLHRLQAASVRNSAYALRLIGAVSEARNKLEYLLDSDFDSLASSSEMINPYQLSWTVTDDEPGPRCKRVTVKAQWLHRGTLKSATLERIMCRH